MLKFAIGYNSLAKEFDMIQHTMALSRSYQFSEILKHAENVSGSKHEKIRTFSFGSASAAKLDTRKKKSTCYLTNTSFEGL